MAVTCGLWVLLGKVRRWNVSSARDSDYCDFRPRRTTPLRRSMDATPIGAERGQVPERAAPGPSKNFWRVRRRANFTDHESARSCCEPSRRLEAVKRRWNLLAGVDSRRASGRAVPCAGQRQATSLPSPAIPIFGQGFAVVRLPAGSGSRTEPRATRWPTLTRS